MDPSLMMTPEAIQAAQAAMAKMSPEQLAQMQKAAAGMSPAALRAQAEAMKSMTPEQVRERTRERERGGTLAVSAELAAPPPLPAVTAALSQLHPF